MEGMVQEMLKEKSITVVGKAVDSVYVIKDVDVDKVKLEKYSVKCTNDIQSAWESTQVGGESNSDNQTIEVVLQERISEINLAARANVIEAASKNGGKIIKDFITDRAKGGKKTFISELVYFNEVK